MNIIIRQAILQYISSNGATDSRQVIRIFARQFQTSKQRISGNISYMVCKQGNLSIIRNRQNSIIY